MTKREHCKNKPIAYFSGFGGLEIHEVCNAIDSCVYFTVNAWGGNKTYHESKIRYTVNGRPYFKFSGVRIYLDECIKI